MAQARAVHAKAAGAGIPDVAEATPRLARGSTADCGTQLEDHEPEQATDRGQPVTRIARCRTADLGALLPCLLVCADCSAETMEEMSHLQQRC